jgi:hypothetical protein
MKDRVTYKGRRFTVEADFIRSKTCECCKKSGRKLYLHHLKYAYPMKEVRKNPKLALDNTITLCFTCHDVANTIRKLIEADEEILEKLIKLIHLKSLFPFDVGKIDADDLNKKI